MLKVECESCKAPYQIDERRVPPSGLKMRCPKCGHSFLVMNPAGGAATPAAPPAGPPGAAPKPPTMSAMKKTMVGVAPPQPPAAQVQPKPPPPPPKPAAAPAPPPAPPSAPPPLPPMRPQLPSDFPSVLGTLDEADLPVISAGLPATRAAGGGRAAPPAPPQPPPAPRAAAKPASPFGDVDMDLPVVSAGLPAAKGGGSPFERDLPVVAADLPAPRQGHMLDLPVVAGASLPVVAGNLPVVAAGLPVVAGNLPSVAAGLPSVAAHLPSVAAGLPNVAAHLPSVAAGLPTHSPSLPVAKDFGSIDLPDEGRPASSPPGSHGEAHAHAAGPSSFGEIELPTEQPHTRAKDSSDFGDLQLDQKPRSVRPGASVATRFDALGPGASGPPGDGLAFGEVDFGGGADAGVAVDTLRGGRSERPPGGAAATAPVSMRAPAMQPKAMERPGPAPRRSGAGRLVAGGVLLLAIMGGAALHLTSYGAFGYLAIGDKLHADDYATATSAAMGQAEKTMGADTYDAARSAVDGVGAAHQRTPRARPLTAYAAVIDAATTVRFGPDPGRTPRAKQWVGDLPQGEPVKYRDVAQAAQAAADGQLDVARKGLDAAAKAYPGDPVLVDVVLLRGGVELAAHDWAAAVVAYKRAAELSNDARAHFGLATAYDRLGDAANAKKEVDATIAANPLHVGGLTLRARMVADQPDETEALTDLAKILEGPARTKASPAEMSRAWAARAWVQLAKGAASEARDAFAQAVKLDSRNVDALSGEGRLLMSEGRFTEALARFDAALLADPSSPDCIANDAEAKIALERLADAKQQLLDAKAKFPKSVPVLLLLGKVEQHLGNNDAADAALKSAIALVDPKKPDAVLPYVALSALQSARGRLSDAAATLQDAKKKLPPSGALDRAFGEVAELQGEFEAAIADYRAALGKDPKDVSTHFHLARALRRTRKFDEAGGELDRVATVDKDYPGLSLERGLLFEEAGDVEKAIEQFKGALAKAPDDPDLQLRVGSAYVAVGRPDDALPMLKKVLERRPNSAEAEHYIGRAYLLKGRMSQPDALRYLKRAVELDPNRAEYHVYLAWAANDAQPAKMDVARDEIDKALALDKMNPEAYWQRGVLERVEGAIDNAIADEKHALALRPSRYEAHATLAECYEDKNDQGTASAEWVKAIAGDGNAMGQDGLVPHPFWHYRYGKLLADHGNVGGALAQLLPAAQAAEKMDQRPGWLGPVEFLTAEALRKSGRKADAIEHYRRFLEVAPVNSPDRADAQAALTALTGGAH